MEASDSEYFESADEDFQSDDDDTQTVTSNKKCSIESVEDVPNKIENIKLTDISADSDSLRIDNNKNTNTIPSDNLPKDKENNVNSNEKEKVKTGLNKKLGSKVENRIDNVKKKLEETSTSESDQTENVQTVKPECSIVSETHSESKKSSVSSVIESKTEAEKKKCDNIQAEENLWDDSEIDWGKESEEDVKWTEDKHEKVKPVSEEKDEDMWENDDWEAMEKPYQQKPEEPKTENNTSWSSWGNWGVSTLLSSATQGVSSITQGITNVLETGIGVPDPEELARINQAEKDKLKQTSPDNEQDKNTGFGLGNLVMGVSHLTKLVETTGTKVISGGLDTLETIGKKTMEVLQEGDPGFKKKRAFLKIDQDKPVLSQLLREAKEKAEQENQILAEKHFTKKAKNYETLFDDHQGLVHLEALEMLSKQCDIKLQTLLESYTDETLIEMQETMDQVKELCELPDEDDDEQTNWSDILKKLNSAVEEINVPISYKKLIDTWEETEAWLNAIKLEVCDERELHQQAVETLAQLTALAVEQFHKTGELLLVKEHRSTADEADSLVQLTTSLTALIGIAAAKFSDKLNSKSATSKNKEGVNSLITNVFFEAANSSSYIQDAFQLLVPVLQVGAV